ncbi:MAG: hypothetical protein WD490_00670 [Opitutales bacterium]
MRFPGKLIWILLVFPFASLTASTVVLNDPEYPGFNALAIDQPAMDAVLLDDGEVIRQNGQPVVFSAFIDTGASGVVLSFLQATGLHDVPSLGLRDDDYDGVFTEIGVGGEELGNVSRPFGVGVYNESLRDGSLTDFDSFVDYGNHKLWVRRQPGLGEVIDVNGLYLIPSPANIIGMPVIRQRLMVMEVLPSPELDGLGVKGVQTRLLPRGATNLPSTNITLNLRLNDFIAEPPDGEILPSHSTNPVFDDVKITHTRGGGSSTESGTWLFDTGAGSSFVSFEQALSIGLIPSGYETLDDFVDDHDAAGGMVTEIGGVGENQVRVPVLDLDEIRMSTADGFDIVWRKVAVLVMDIPELAELGLDGIFGMNLLAPAVTLDAANLDDLDALLESLLDTSPEAFDAGIFEVIDDERAELRLYSPRASDQIATFGGFFEWRRSAFSAGQINNAAVSGPSGDPDRDGIPNLMEYAVGLNPLFPSREGLPENGTKTMDGEEFLTLTFSRSKAATDIDYIPEVSSDLVRWDSGEAAVEVLDRLDHGDFETVTVRDRKPIRENRQRFIRLRVEQAK